MKKYLHGLFLFLLAPVFLMSFNVNHIDMATAANSDGNISKDFENFSTNVESINTLPLPRACVYDDGVDPKLDPEDCEELGNNEETSGNNNIFFTLFSPKSFDSYTCNLQDRVAGILVSSFDCGVSSNVAEADFSGLEDGDYTFTVTAQRTINDDTPATPDIVDEAASPPFNFRVSGGAADIGDFADSPSLSTERSSQFKDLLLSNEKVGFINLEKKLKNNEITNTTSLTCFNTNTERFGEGRIVYEELNCNRLLIFTTTPLTSTSVSNMSEQGSPYSNDMYIYKVNNALSNGINGKLVSCGFIFDTGQEDDESDRRLIDVNPIPCRAIFIAYEISS